MLGELEGQFASIYSTRFLLKTNLKDEAEKLRKNHLNSILISSYLLMLNHILYVTANEDSFNLEEANKMLFNELQKSSITITEEDIPDITSIQSYETITNIVCYLISLELINKTTDLSELLNILYSLKLYDSTCLIENLDKHKIAFYKNDYENLKKEYKLTNN